MSVEKLLSLYQLLQQRTDWSKENDKDGVSLSSIVLEGEDIRCYKLETVIKDKQPSQLADFVWSFDQEQWKELQSDVAAYSVLEQQDDKTQICYQENSLPWPLKNRETVYQNNRVQQGDTHYLLRGSTSHSSKPEGEKDLVRTQLTIDAFTFAPCDNGTSVARVLHINPQGKIPASIVNMFASKHIDFMLKLVAAAEKL